MVGRNLLQVHGMLGAVKPVDQQLWTGLGQTGRLASTLWPVPNLIALAKPFVSQRLLEGTDGCQMPGEQSLREDPEGQEEGEWIDGTEGERQVCSLACQDYSSHLGPLSPMTEEPGKLSFRPIFSLSAALIPSP